MWWTSLLHCGTKRTHSVLFNFAISSYLGHKFECHLTLMKNHILNFIIFLVSEFSVSVSGTEVYYSCSWDLDILFEFLATTFTIKGPSIWIYYLSTWYLGPGIWVCYLMYTESSFAKWVSERWYDIFIYLNLSYWYMDLITPCHLWLVLCILINYL